MALAFDDASGRFRDSSGRFVSEASVRSVVDAVADLASTRMATASQAMLDGTMSLASWQAELQGNIKLAHVATATIAHGGAERMNFSRYGQVGNEIKAQYQFLRAFAEQIASGEQKLNDGLTARARQYGQASRVTYEKIRGEEAVRRGLDECRNQTHSGETCSECRALSARGWLPASEMPPIGSRICRSNCKCTLDRRRHRVGAAA